MGSVVFLVFIGGILVILFYLGMYGNYYKLSNLGIFFVWLLLLFLPLTFNKFIFINSTGESSLTFYVLIFLSLLSLFLFFLLKGIRKILGVGRAMRSFI